MRRWFVWIGVGVAVGISGLTLLRWVLGYHPVINVGESLRGVLFLCRPLQPTDVLRRGMIMQYIPPRRVRAMIHVLVPAAEPDLPWLKRAAAVGGDQVCWFAETVYINAELAGRLEPLLRLVAPPGMTCQRLGPAEVLPLGDAPDSFDGRYHGPLHRKEIGEVCHKIF
jgi:type IV secretory pathway protease TraF